MPVSLKQFCKSLCDSGVMSADEVRAFLDTFPPTGGQSTRKTSPGS